MNADKTIHPPFAKRHMSPLCKGVKGGFCGGAACCARKISLLLIFKTVNFCRFFRSQDYRRHVTAMDSRSPIGVEDKLRGNDRMDASRCAPTQPATIRLVRDICGQRVLICVIRQSFVSFVFQVFCSGCFSVFSVPSVAEESFRSSSRVVPRGESPIASLNDEIDNRLGGLP
jgi:hypothetical protein